MQVNGKGNREGYENRGSSATPKGTLDSFVYASTKSADDLPENKKHTPGHENCPACGQADQVLQLDDVSLANLPFGEAAKIWMLLRRRTNLRPRTHETTQGYLDALGKFFTQQLRTVTAGQVREYQIARGANRLLVAKPGAPGDAIETHPWDDGGQFPDQS